METYFQIQGVLTGEERNITPEQMSDFYDDFLNLLSKHNLQFGGGYCPVDENLNPITD